MFKRKDLPYRQSSLGYVIDRKNHFLIVNKNSYKNNEWSFPGGGIEGDETPRQAILRELEEELCGGNFEIISESKNLYRYEWPDDVVEREAKKRGIYLRGEELYQFLVLFDGDKKELRASEEIRKIKWVLRNELKYHLIFTNQYENAEKVLNELIK